MKKIAVIDGQGGGIGRLIIEKLIHEAVECEICAIGTNSIATSAMLRAGAHYGATGENPTVVACRDAYIVTGPIGIVVADSLAGEVTPSMAVAVGSCAAQKVLLPIDRCGNFVVGVSELPVQELVTIAVDRIVSILNK